MTIWERTGVVKPKMKVPEDVLRALNELQELANMPQWKRDRRFYIELMAMVKTLSSRVWSSATSRTIYPTRKETLNNHVNVFTWANSVKAQAERLKRIQQRVGCQRQSFPFSD